MSVSTLERVSEINCKRQAYKQFLCFTGKALSKGEAGD